MCRYCDPDPHGAEHLLPVYHHHRGQKEIQVSIYPTHPNLHPALWLEFQDITTKVLIYYCPLCGKKLT